jgi:hypothetical protein
VDGVEIVLVTPASHPLGVFGAAASEAIERLLAERGIVVHSNRHPLDARAGVLRLAPALAPFLAEQVRLTGTAGQSS